MSADNTESQVPEAVETEEPAAAPAPDESPKPAAAKRRKRRGDAPTKAPAQQEPLIYIGPRLPNGKLFNLATFRHGVLPAHVEALIKECPDLKFLFVTPARLREARANLGDKASVVAAKAAAVRKHFYKGDR